MMKQGLWRALESLADGAVMAEWALELGNEFERAQHFLRPTQDEAKTYPCTNRFPCGCRHRVEPVRNGQRVAVCDCGDCAPIRLTAADLTVFELDMTRLAEAVTRACGWERTRFDEVVRGVWRLGSWVEWRTSVLWCVIRREEQTRALLDAPAMVESSPYLLVVPTRASVSPRMDSVLKREGCLALPLDELLAVESGGKFKLVKSLEAVRHEFDERRAKWRDGGKMLQEIHDRFEVFGAEFRDLRTENDELRRLHAEGFFKFALKVEAADFQAFAVILALGNRSAAAKHLKIPQRSFYDLVDKWETRGREYQLMSRFIEWRKRSSRHIEVRLDESLQSGESGGSAENPETLRAVLDEVNASKGTDYPDLLADILGALQRQNAANWPKVRDEVVRLIKEELPQ